MFCSPIAPFSNTATFSGCGEVPFKLFIATPLLLLISLLSPPLWDELSPLDSCSPCIALLMLFLVTLELSSWIVTDMGFVSPVLLSWVTSTVNRELSPSSAVAACVLDWCSGLACWEFCWLFEELLALSSDLSAFFLATSYRGMVDIACQVWYQQWMRSIRWEIVFSMLLLCLSSKGVHLTSSVGLGEICEFFRYHFWNILRIAQFINWDDKASNTSTSQAFDVICSIFDDEWSMSIEKTIPHWTLPIHFLISTQNQL